MNLRLLRGEISVISLYQRVMGELTSIVILIGHCGISIPLTGFLLASTNLYSIRSIHAQDPPPVSDAKFIKQLQGLYAKDAAEYAIYRDAKHQEKLELQAEPVYLWTNVIRQSGRRSAAVKTQRNTIRNISIGCTVIAGSTRSCQQILPEGVVLSDRGQIALCPRQNVLWFVVPPSGGS